MAGEQITESDKKNWKILAQDWVDAEMGREAQVDATALKQAKKKIDRRPAYHHMCKKDHVLRTVRGEGYKAFMPTPHGEAGNLRATGSSLQSPGVF
jgi:Cft2 family RNA processing exonuclease